MALAEARDCFGSDAVLNVVGSRINPPGRTSFISVAAVLSATSQADEHVHRAVTFRLTGNAMNNMERGAFVKAHRLFGADAELRVVASRVEEAPGGSDAIQAPFLGEFDIAVFPRAAAGTRRCVLTLVDVITGNGIEQMERRARHEGRQFFGPDAEYRVVFKDGVDGVESTPFYIETEDRFYARSVDVEVILSSSAQDEEPAGEHVLTLHDTIRGNSRKQLEREARRRLGGRLGRGAVLQVRFRDGFFGATSDEKDAAGRYFAVIVDVSASGGAA